MFILMHVIGALTVHLPIRDSSIQGSLFSQIITMYTYVCNELYVYFDLTWALFS